MNQSHCQKVNCFRLHQIVAIEAALAFHFEQIVDSCLNHGSFISQSNGIDRSEVPKAVATPSRSGTARPAASSSTVASTARRCTASSIRRRASNVRKR